MPVFCGRGGRPSCILCVCRKVGQVRRRVDIAKLDRKRAPTSSKALSAIITTSPPHIWSHSTTGCHLELTITMQYVVGMCFRPIYFSVRVPPSRPERYNHKKDHS